MEQKKSRKEWIKTVAIIFLTVMLILTFFSQTILNYSLPEVAAQYCYSGEITNKVRGTGTVEASDPYSVIFKETRKVDSVSVKVGDEVEKGDVLYTLDEEESDELKEAEKALETAKATYDKDIVTGGISKATTSAIENGTMASVSDAQAAIDAKKATIASLEKEVANIQAQIDLYSDSTPAKYVTARQELESLQADLASWTTQNEINSSNLADVKSGELKDDMDTKKTVYEADESNTTNKEAYETAKKKYDEAVATAQTACNTSSAKVTELTKAVAAKQAEISDALYNLNKSLATKQAALTQANSDLTDLLSDYATAYTLKSEYDDIQDKAQALAELQETAAANTIVAPVSGTVLAMDYVAGETIEQGTEVASIQIAGKGYTLSMEVTNDKAKLVSVGDEAEIVNSWWYTDVKARVKQIKPSTTNKQNGKVIVFELDGDVTDGQSLSLTVGSRTANYDYVVPTSAIREDNNGKFVLRVISKSAPFGNRYIAERVDVTVLAEDDTMSAVSGTFEGYDYIITTTSKPVSDGNQIRLKD